MARRHAPKNPEQAEQRARERRAEIRASQREERRQRQAAARAPSNAELDKLNNQYQKAAQLFEKYKANLDPPPNHRPGIRRHPSIIPFQAGDEGVEYFKFYHQCRALILNYKSTVSEEFAVTLPANIEKASQNFEATKKALTTIINHLETLFPKEDELSAPIPYAPSFENSSDMDIEEDDIIPAASEKNRPSSP